MSRVDFEWQVSDDGLHVRERLVGTELSNTYGPMPKHVTDSFIKARRLFVHRFITTHAQAIQIFEPRPQLISPAGAPPHET